MQRQQFTNRSSSNDNQMLPEYADIPIDPSVENNLLRIKRDMGGSDDLIMRQIHNEGINTAAAAVVYIDGLSNAMAINQYIFDVLDYSLPRYDGEDMMKLDAGSLAKKLLNGMGPVRTVTDLGSLYKNLLSGQAIIMLRGHQYAYCADIREWKGRDVTESTNQTSIRGPRESFTETLRTNTSLIRRKIKDPRLWMETVTIGRMTKTDVTLMYINGLAKPDVLQLVRDRLRAIKIDGILDSGYIEELIEDNKWSLFPTIFNTELPDNVAGQLLEGRVAILVEGTPNVLIAPSQMVTFFQSTEDYYQRTFYASLLRILRFGSVFISLLFPSLYIAITTFHRDMLPASLLISLAAQREGVPFPAFFEALIMEITFEILREAGLRMPRAIGQAVSVVGTLVIGQAAVEAGIVSAAMVIVVSITAISTFTLPAYSMSIPVRILRFAFMGVAASFGLFGIIMGFFVLMLHLCALRSFGEPFMAPLSPFIKTDMQDALFRLPRWLMFKRPETSLKTDSSRIRKN
ncbi:spore germination protein [Paenibacillus sp. ATY16]|uniref:spore germination protein n=1 Tax=Paenibacillus sp. ATY16 TaxID=1759312 RepID=UPI00200C6790|nr:spore germination protein [Paenibacillus sp. ATY16]MCK9860720.1 spore germination protein [Paenibacillus sp. ATY16]